MYKALFVIVMLAWAQATMAAPDTESVMASVQKFVDAFNQGDTNAVGTGCTDQASIIDEFPPHEWHGAGACAKWMDDYDADAKKNGITNGLVTLGKPRHVDITGDLAYVVVPADYAFKQKGTPVKETASMLTVALRKGEAGWKITAWAWAKN